MNKRYIDFVPKTKKIEAAGVGAASGGAVKKNTTQVTAGQKNASNGRMVGVRVKRSAGVQQAKQITSLPTNQEVRRQAASRRRIVNMRPRVRAKTSGRPGQVARGDMSTQASINKAVDADAVKKMRIVEQEEIRLEEIFAEKPSDAAEARKFGVIEDFSRKFVHTDVEKRPLSAAKVKAEATEVKAKKISRIPLLSKTKAKEKTVKKPELEVKAPEKKPETATVGKMKIPERPFVNMEKVEKRPLSRNMYQPRKVVEAPKEEPQGPITIIEKPEKDSRIGLIVTIIITIILGAAAGTVAFLLLPK